LVLLAYFIIIKTDDNRKDIILIADTYINKEAILLYFSLKKIISSLFFNSSLVNKLFILSLNILNNSFFILLTSNLNNINVNNQFGISTKNKVLNEIIFFILKEILIKIKNSKKIQK
jgi:hypothetical protein